MSSTSAFHGNSRGHTKQDAAPLPAQHPAAICCFVSIPGMGKTALTNTLLHAPGLDSNAGLNVQVLNSDRMKSQPGFINSQYWSYVANAAGRNRKGPTIVVADKNLCPSPIGNVQKVCATIKGSGALTVAVVPSWRGQPQTDVGVAYPTIPWPLEVVALCMLRTLLRTDHEGQLDASLNKALRVVVLFVRFYKNMSYSDIVNLCCSQFTVVTQVPVMDLDATDPNKQVPLRLLQHIAWGIANYNDSTRDGLPASWETQARAMLLQRETVQMLQRLQTSLEDSHQCLMEALIKSLAFGQGPAA